MHTNGIWHRPADRAILAEVPGVYGNVPITRDDVVLDLGAHIGIASRLFLDKGARGVVAVEADPANIPLLRRNLHGRKATVLPAIVGDVPGRAAFYTRRDRTFVGSTLPDPTRKRVSVAVLPLSGLLTRYRPTVVKADIEFSEYDLSDLRCLPEHVRVLAMEVHIRYTGIFAGRTMDADELTARRIEAADLIASIEGQGFREHWRKDKNAKPGEPRAKKDDSGLGPMVKCVCATWVR